MVVFPNGRLIEANPSTNGWFSGTPGPPFQETSIYTYITIYIDTYIHKGIDINLLNHENMPVYIYIYYIYNIVYIYIMVS